MICSRKFCWVFVVSLMWIIQNNVAGQQFAGEKRRSRDISPLAPIEGEGDSTGGVLETAAHYGEERYWEWLQSQYPLLNTTDKTGFELNLLMYATLEYNISDTIKDMLAQEVSAMCWDFNEHHAGQVYCNSTWDTVLCWPTTPAGQLAVLACPPRYEDIELDPDENATRICYPNGTWQEKSDYSFCALFQEYQDEDIHNFITRIIYYVGFTISLVALGIALFIFLYFRSLRCLRNTIHSHLIATFIFRNVLWLILNVAMLHLEYDKQLLHHVVCVLILSLYNYIQVANFFWMLVEGLYLHIMIVWAFSAERIRFWYYAVIGWACPALVVLAWAGVKLKYENITCWLPQQNSHFDYIYIAPILAVLLVNVIFLGSIVYVLVTKLHATNTLQARQYRKAVRGTLILFPLLGVTYVLFIYPVNDSPVGINLFIYFNTILQSFQGLAIATFYCFLNGEVQGTVSAHFSRWKEGRSITTRYTRGSVATNAEQISLRASFSKDIPNGRTNFLPTNNNLVRNILHEPATNGTAPSPSFPTPILLHDEERL